MLCRRSAPESARSSCDGQSPSFFRGDRYTRWEQRNLFCRNRARRAAGRMCRKPVTFDVSLANIGMPRRWLYAAGPGAARAGVQGKRARFAPISTTVPPGGNAVVSRTRITNVITS